MFIFYHFWRVNSLLKVLFAGLLVSFLGTLPFGTINITAFQIAASQNISQAILFAIAVILVELVAVRITLVGANKLNFKHKAFKVLLPLVVIFLLWLAFSSFFSAGETKPQQTTAALFPGIQSAFLLGILLGVLNPLQFPFWLGWNSILISKNILHNTKNNYSFYMTGIAIGSFGALLIFILAGKLIFKHYEEYHSLIAVVAGFLYLSFAVYIPYRFYKLKSKVSLR